MQKIFLTAILFLFATPTFACECHGSGTGFGFGAFAARQLATADCIPTHITMVNGEFRYEAVDPNATTDLTEEPLEEGVEPSFEESE